jgi:hypothetical protein
MFLPIDRLFKNFSIILGFNLTLSVTKPIVNSYIFTFQSVALASLSSRDGLMPAVTAQTNKHKKGWPTVGKPPNIWSLCLAAALIYSRMNTWKIEAMFVFFWLPGTSPIIWISKSTPAIQCLLKGLCHEYVKVNHYIWIFLERLLANC